MHVDLHARCFALFAGRLRFTRARVNPPFFAVLSSRDVSLICMNSQSNLVSYAAQNKLPGIALFVGYKVARAT